MDSYPANSDAIIPHDYLCRTVRVRMVFYKLPMSLSHPHKTVRILVNRKVRKSTASQ